MLEDKKLETVYNPFSILNFFDDKSFNSYWFKSATPSFLIELLNKYIYEVPEDENNIILNISELEKFEVERINLPSLLFQAGYLTIESYSVDTDMIKLKYPNEEVRKSFSILDIFNLEHSHNAKSLAKKIDKTLFKNKNNKTRLIDSESILNEFKKTNCTHKFSEEEYNNIIYFFNIIVEKWILPFYGIDKKELEEAFKKINYEFYAKLSLGLIFLIAFPNILILAPIIFLLFGINLPLFGVSILIIPILFSTGIYISYCIFFDPSKVTITYNTTSHSYITRND